jgi:hypothetical protein
LPGRGWTEFFFAPEKNTFVLTSLNSSYFKLVQLASFKPSSSAAGASTSTTAPPTQGPPARTISKKKVSKKEEASKARLQELIDQYAPKK